MKKIAFTLVWILCFLLSLAVCDQFLLRYPGADTPLFSDFQRFYQDFRHRLLYSNGRPTATPARRSNTVATANKTVSAKSSQPRYIYVDKNNTLNFATNMDEIPPALRSSAKKLDN